jgi:hypothetical protein
MAETRPNAEAPQAIASAASAGDLMQQILTLGRICTGVSKPPNDPKLNHGHRRPAQQCNNHNRISSVGQN